jgi:hypothetical protein
VRPLLARNRLMPEDLKRRALPDDLL